MGKDPKRSQKPWFAGDEGVMAKSSWHLLVCFAQSPPEHQKAGPRTPVQSCILLLEDMRFIAVFLFGVFVVVLLLGSCLYAAEGGQDVTSIPAGMWCLGCFIGSLIASAIDFCGPVDQGTCSWDAEKNILRHLLSSFRQGSRAQSGDAIEMKLRPADATAAGIKVGHSDHLHCWLR